MILFLVLAVSILATAMISIGAIADIEIGAKDDPRALAEQMVIYHSAAGRHCATTICTDNAVVPSIDAQLPSYRRGHSAFDGTRIVAVKFSDGAAPGAKEYLVTYMSDRDARVTQSYGRMRAAFTRMIPNERGAWFGVISPSGGVEITGERTWGATSTAITIDASVPVPPGLLSGAVGAPLLISRM